MEQFQQYVNEQFVGKDPNRPNVGRDIFKSLKENWKEKIGYIPLKPMALIKVSDKENPDIIKSLGFSEPNDILLDNFGVYLSSCINTGADVQRNVVDYTGIVRTVHFQENGNTRMCFSVEGSPATAALGGYTQLGSGVTPPARPDYEIEVPLTVSPLTGFLTPLTPVWFSASQEVLVYTITTPALLGGNINECGMFGRLRIGFSTSVTNFMISHDAASASFNAGDHIELTYTWSIS